MREYLWSQLCSSGCGYLLLPCLREIRDPPTPVPRQVENNYFSKTTMTQISWMFPFLTQYIRWNRVQYVIPCNVHDAISHSASAEIKWKIHFFPKGPEAPIRHWKVTQGAVGWRGNSRRFQESPPPPHPVTSNSFPRMGFMEALGHSGRQGEGTGILLFLKDPCNIVRLLWHNLWNKILVIWLLLYFIKLQAFGSFLYLCLTTGQIGYLGHCPL